MRNGRLILVSLCTAICISVTSYLLVGWLKPPQARAMAMPDGPIHQMHGQDPELRSGADANNPYTLPFLPHGHFGSGANSAAKSQTRVHFPQPYGKDLAAGLSCRIETEWPDQTFHDIERTKFPFREQLTNQQFASLHFSDPGWVGLLRQYGRCITIDLKQVKSIHALSLDFLQDLRAGVDFPDRVVYEVSQDGCHWATVGESQSLYGGGDFTPQAQSFETVLRNDVDARFVRAKFTNKVFAFVDEFSVYGSDALNPGDITPTGHESNTFPTAVRGYLKHNQHATGGIRDMMLAYTNGYGHLGTWEASDFMPMLASLDQSGKPKRWLFDSVLFGPYGNMPTSEAAWSNWIANIFMPDIQISALDHSVGALKRQLHRPKFKEKIVINIPITYDNPHDFGALEPGRQSLDFDPAEVGQQVAFMNKVHAIQWFIQQVNHRWEAAHFRNLELVGFYWEPEAVIPSEPYDEQLIRQAAAVVHKMHRLFYWIPYYGAPGVTDANRLGFDAVMIQPNTSFNWQMNAQSRLSSTAQMAKTYGMGVELEAHWDVISRNVDTAKTAQDKYYNYFTAGKLYGYGSDVLKSYYLNSKTLVTAYAEKSPFYHRIYDRTVQFMNGRWQETRFR